MPEVMRFWGLRFLFYSNDHEPIHIHVVKGKGPALSTAKFSLSPVFLVENHGLSKGEIKMAEGLLEENEDIFINRWKEYFKHKSDETC